jgi:hypothetical protein
MAARIQRQDAKTPRRQGFLSFASLHLCAFALKIPAYGLKIIVAAGVSPLHLPLK